MLLHTGAKLPLYCPIVTIVCLTQHLSHSPSWRKYFTCTLQGLSRSFTQRIRRTGLHLRLSFKILAQIFAVLALDFCSARWCIFIALRTKASRQVNKCHQSSDSTILKQSTCLFLISHSKEAFRLIDDHPLVKHLRSRFLELKPRVGCPDYLHKVFWKWMFIEDVITAGN